MAYKTVKLRHLVLKIPVVQHLKSCFQISNTKKHHTMTLVKVNHPANRTFDLFRDLMNEIPSTVSKSFREDILHYPPVNIIDNAERYSLELSAPGFDKVDFSIKLERNLLTISAEKKTESEENNGKVLRREFSAKSFNRTFTVDEKIDADKISAKYENGILTVDLAKKEPAIPETKQITIS